MTECGDLVPLLLRAADGTIDVSGRLRLDAHLATCDACRDALAAQVAVRGALAPLGFGRVSPDFAARVRARVAPRGAWLDLTNWRAWTLGLAPVAALLCLLALWPAGASTSRVPLSTAVTSWATGSTGQTPLILDASTGRDALISAALGESTR